MPFLRPPLPAADSADRVRALLARPAGGWVPPVEALDQPSGGRTWNGQPWAGQPSDGRALADPALDDPALDDPALDDPAVSDPASSPGLDRERAVQPDSSRSAPAAHRRPRRWTGVLPVSLRAGRVVPGHRAAAALVLVAVLAALVAAAVVMRGRPEPVAVPTVVDRGRTSAPGTPGGAPSPSTELVVAVAGQVLRPGVVRLPPGSRVADAVAAAGGAAPGASTGLLNLARKLVDGEQVLVGVEPPAGAAGPAGAGSTSGSSPSGRGGLLDLNTASASDLDALPGIGPVLAERIVEWRADNDRFGSVEQLREVTGIGEAKFQDLKTKVTV